ncbi:MAG TPA: DUF1062 domain-containing protein [Candidatus Eisenbergiella intestinigallinarum]|uniref:DUF1062 domain-containing protein n=1 Tax=Candidatus Eisenbergiella intestinigallinarum TaxID=2838549 RepID=A0A9D2QLC3_9FIRM|nr:DUF1062 domain-containing protein [Candidatus Eisenbergiella intestinigallinarum]
MQKSEIWMIKPVKPPAVRRQCPGCGKDLYESTGRFRVNANGNRLDVWLIYRCMQCGKSWNMEILERVESGKLSEEKLLKYQENDEEEALRAACSNFLMNQNRVEALWETLEYEVEKSGREELMQEPHRISDQAAVIVIRIRNEYGLPIRFGRLLAGELGISGGKVKTLVETGKIRLPEGMTLKSKISVTAQTGLCIYLEDLGGTG